MSFIRDPKFGDGFNNLNFGGGLMFPPPPQTNSLFELVAENYRRRQEWNDRFSHWERSETDSETQRIERARDMVQQALAKNIWLRSEGSRIVPQGSFTNRTNTRLDADIDLRVQHPSIKIECGPGVDWQQAWREGGYYDKGGSLADVAANILSAKETHRRLSSCTRTSAKLLLYAQDHRCARLVG